MRAPVHLGGILVLAATGVWGAGMPGLDPLGIPAVPVLDPAEVAAHLGAGRVVEAQRLCSSWRYRQPAEAARPLLALVKAIHQLDRSATRVPLGRLTLLRLPGLRAPADPEDLERFYRETARELLGDESPPPLTVHLVPDLDPLVHGAHFAGHLAVDARGWPQVARHELVHALMARHPAREALRGRDYWLEEGLAEVLGRQEDPRLTAWLPLREEVPASPGELFPPQGIWRGRHPDPAIDYLGAMVAAQLLLGGPSPFTPGPGVLLDDLAARSRLDPLLARRFPGGRQEFDARWVATMRREYSLGEGEVPPGANPWQVRARYLGPARRGRWTAAADAFLGELPGFAGSLPGWMLTDAIRLGEALGRAGDPAAMAALARLAEQVPLVGLTATTGLRDASWSRRVLDRVLEAHPPPRLLLYLTLMTWGSAHQGAVEAAWGRGFARHADETAWLQGEGVRIAYRGRLDPADEDFAAVHLRLQRLAARLEGRTDPDLGLVDALEEARAAYAFGAGDFAASAAVLEGTLARRGLEARTLLNLGAARLRAGQLERAQEVYRAGILLDPSFPGLRLGLAVTHLQRGDLPGARRLLEEAPRDTEDEPRRLATLAAVRRAQGEVLEAERLVAEAAARGFRTGGSPVPAEFRVMIETGLEPMLEELRGTPVAAPVGG